MEQSVIFDLDLIRRYDKSGPRYTSYPTAVQFHDEFTGLTYRSIAEGTNAERPPRPLSLYFHIPFCDTVCFYCGCNKIATKDRSRAEPYLERVYRELALQAPLFDQQRIVEQLHWGGGTPTFISHQQMRDLMAETRRHFTLRDDDSGEYSIEIDPREVQQDTIKLLRELGFNRMSLGAQDFEPVVQQAVNRIQSEQQTFAVLDQAREQGFKSISIDLIYGLPLQTVASFERTLDKVISASPDRLSVFNYAHLPEMFKPQRRINESDLPLPAVKLDILDMAITRLTEAGYVYIGMDHFAKPNDELSIAQRERTLYRNFQGYSTHADCDLIGLGVTSIGKVGRSYSQNHKDIESYYQAIDADQIPVFKGVELDDDDVLRRDIITQLMCHFELRPAAIEQVYGLKFDEYFSQEVADLLPMQQDGLVEMTNDRITVMPRGRLLIRNVCMVFDRYMRNPTQTRYSKVI